MFSGQEPYQSKLFGKLGGLVTRTLQPLVPSSPSSPAAPSIPDSHKYPFIPPERPPPPKFGYPPNKELMEAYMRQRRERQHREAASYGKPLGQISPMSMEFQAADVPPIPPPRRKRGQGSSHQRSQSTSRLAQSSDSRPYFTHRGEHCLHIFSV